MRTHSLDITIRCNFDLTKWSTRRLRFDHVGTGLFRASSPLQFLACERVGFVERAIRRRATILAIEGPASHPTGYWLRLTGFMVATLINESKHTGYGDYGMAIWHHPRVGSFNAAMQGAGKMTFLRITAPSHVLEEREIKGRIQNRIVRKDGTRKGP
jgi:hypothetical protein